MRLVKLWVPGIRTRLKILFQRPKKVLGPLRRAFLGEGSGIRPRFGEASNQNSTARVEIVSAHYDTLEEKTEQDGPTITISGTNRFD